MHYKFIQHKHFFKLLIDKEMILALHYDLITIKKKRTVNIAQEQRLNNTIS